MSELSVTGPSDETEYYLYRPRMTEHEYQDVARSLTRQVLAISPRQVNEIRIQGTVSLMKSGGAEDSSLETLREAGFTITDGHINGQAASSPDVVDAILSAYTPGLHHALFVDTDGYGIAARYDGSLQHYWLPTTTASELKESLDPAVRSAFLSTDELEDIKEEGRTENGVS
ncbi:hypothetical protein [Haloarcula brevis]|uniref:hypothetical protein n=1 Tax=Haloarcula brevis TaxID=3111453 RepID=UPI00300F7A48